MNKTSETHTPLEGRTVSVTIGLCIGLALLFTGGCEKADQPRPAPQPTASHALNAQEQTMVGNWNFQRKETYEMAGTDSLGNCQCNLLVVSACDSACDLTFFNTLTATGSIGHCGGNAGFNWSIPQPGTLKANDTFYHIEYACKDSIALSSTYTKDILQLKDVFYYWRK